MGVLNNGRVNIVITDRTLRYTYHKYASVESLVTHGEVELPKDTIKDGAVYNHQVLHDIVSQLVRQHKWKRKKLYFCVPDDTVVIRQLQVPAALTEEEADAYVKTQLGNNLYLPFDNPATAIKFLESDNDMRDILLYAYPQEKINAYETIFQQAGLNPVAADLTALSVYRYYELLKRENKDHVLHIHWNQDALVLTAFQKHKAIFTRYMKLDALAITEEQAEHIISDYLVEINRIIDFYRYSITKGEANINLLLVTGDFPFLTIVNQRLTDTIELPIHGFENSELPVKYADVLGLALKKEIS